MKRSGSVQGSSSKLQTKLCARVLKGLWVVPTLTLHAACGETEKSSEPAPRATRKAARRAHPRWRAYLSTTAFNARERIGKGPWRNVAGVIVANDVEELHAQAAGEALDGTWPPGDLTIALTEKGEPVPNSIHDILTGSLPDGTVDGSRHCNEWTSSEAADEASVGHSNRTGGGSHPTSTRRTKLVARRTRRTIRLVP